ncbi:MAG: PTS sugar transporter [Microbacterium sp.]
MRILVVCGAGASSTFVAQRLRHAAERADLACTTAAGTPQSLVGALGCGDLVLVGPHLATALDDIARDAAAHGAHAALLPDDVFGDLDGTRTLDLVRAALATAGDPAPAGTAHDHPGAA